MKETKFKQTLVQTKKDSRHCEERSDAAIHGGFKKTEVGLIPNDWKVKPFKNVATLINGRAFSQSELLERGKYRVLRVGNFGTNDSWYYSNLELPEKMYCNKGDLLYCWSCTYGAYIWNEEKTIYHYHIWKIADLKAEKGYLQYILNNDVAQQMNSSNGSTMSHITKGFLENRLFAFPPTIEEQQSIAKALSDVDTLIANLEKLIAKKKNIKQGAMQQLLTGKKRLPGFTGKWSDFVLGQSGILLKNSINPQFSATKYFSEYSMPAYDEIQKPERVLGCSMHSNRTQISGEVLLFNKLNVRQKRVWYVRKCAENAVCSMEFLPYCSKKIDLQLLRQILLTDEITFDFIGMSTGTSNSQKRIAPKNFLDYSLRLPQDIREQKAIAEILVDMDSEIQALNKKIIQYRKLKTGMMQQLLTGKIRLVK